MPQTTKPETTAAKNGKALAASIAHYPAFRNDETGGLKTYPCTPLREVCEETLRNAKSIVGDAADMVIRCPDDDEEVERYGADGRILLHDPDFGAARFACYKAAEVLNICHALGMGGADRIVKHAQKTGDFIDAFAGSHGDDWREDDASAKQIKANIDKLHAAIDKYGKDYLEELRIDKPHGDGERVYPAKMTPVWADDGTGQPQPDGEVELTFYFNGRINGGNEIWHADYAAYTYCGEINAKGDVDRKLRGYYKSHERAAEVIRQYAKKERA
ncbi:MAG: hypothetical protein ACR2PR_09390 [Pseudohongiellaceae bacterium]